MNQEKIALINSFIKNDLNKQQQKAVTKKNGALLVIAGAGSGKTRVIATRIANLILNENALPQSIIALTFTNKAAKEMKDRIAKFLGTDARLPFVGTFHSYCLLLLRSNRHLLDKADFSILDSDDQIAIVRQIIRLNGLEKQFKPNQIIYQLSKLKNELALNPAALSDDYIHPRIKEIFLAYEADKNAANCYDFDDLILKILSLFKTNSEFKSKFQANTQHVLVDEYQDTSATQHELLRQMALDENKKFNLSSLCAVGDEDQSIYSWRGANVLNMIKLKSDFAPVTTIKLEQNYRSVKPILQAANSLIENNEQRNPKKLWTDKAAKNRILSLTCRSGEQEAESIARFMQSLPENQKLNDIAILYRTHFQSRSIEEALIYHGIAYRIIGGIRFYERKEIKDVLAYLRLIVNPFDKISLMRIINYPLRGLGKKFEDQLLALWMQNPFFDFKQLLAHMCENADITLSTGKKAALKYFLGVFATINRDDSPSTIAHHVLKKIDYLNYLRTTLDSKEADTKIENVQELMQSISEFEQKPEAKGSQLHPDDPFYIDRSKPTLENFLHEVTLLQEKNDQETDEQVQMMSLHAAKGLEFHTVIIAGLEEELLPSARSLNTTEQLEEERRLFYVGITRAKEYLVFTRAQYRNRFGVIVNQAPSRFFFEIGDELVHSITIDELHSSQLPSVFARWLGTKAKVVSELMTASTFLPAQKPLMSKSRTNFKRSAKPTFRKKTTTPSFKTKNMQVKHKKFGLGIVVEVQPAPDNQEYITAIFKVGKKKILSSFLEKL